MSRRTRSWIVTSALVGLAAVAALSGCSSSDSGSAASPSTTSSSPPSGEVAGVVTYDGLSRRHVNHSVDYPQSPPVGGPHDPRWLTCTGTVYDTRVRNENAVHSMEHGAVWVTYSPTLPAADVAVLAAAVRGTRYTMLSPYAGLDSPVVLTAWGRQLAVDSVDDPRVREFIATYANGPQTPEPGSPCRGGVRTSASSG